MTSKTNSTRTQFGRAVPAGIVAFGLTAGVVLGQANPPSDEIAVWNGVMFQAAQAAGTPPFAMTRVAAIVQGAVYDAVNGIERRYTPLHVTPAAAPGASPRAAVVLAAYTTLANLYPAQQSMLDRQLAASLSSVARGASLEQSVSIRRGMEWGQAVGTSILAWRSTDGFTPPPPPFLGGALPGEWRPTPPQFLPGAGPQFAYMTPWVIQSPSQFRPAGPPPLDSARYAADVNEVQRIGSIDTPFRSPDQTLLARFWQSTTPNYIFNRAALALAANGRLKFAEEAWLLALLNTAMADADIACWDGKYHFAFWRPITAIRMADVDGNPSTSADPAWSPLLVTPAIPDYPSGHATLAGAAAAVLSAVFGANTPVELTSDAQAMAGVVRRFNGFSELVSEVIEARILAGIHFRTADVDGQATGTAVARYVLDNAFLPVR